MVPVPISAGVIFTSLLLAFNTWIRALIWYIIKVPVTKIFIHTHLYNLWLYMNRPSKSLYQGGVTQIEELKEKVKLERFKRHFEKDFFHAQVQAGGNGWIPNGNIVQSASSSSSTDLPPFANGSAGNNRQSLLSRLVRGNRKGNRTRNGDAA